MLWILHNEITGSEQELNKICNRCQNHENRKKQKMDVSWHDKYSAMENQMQGKFSTGIILA